VVNAGDGKILCENINTTTRKTEPLLEVSREVGLKVNTGTKYVVVSRHQNSERNHNLLIANKSFENVAQFKNLGTTVTIENYIQQKIKIRLNSGNVCHYSVQSLLSSHNLSKNSKIKIHKSLTLPVDLYGAETWSLSLSLSLSLSHTLTEGHRLRV
jgi:hypothetical protein